MFSQASVILFTGGGGGCGRHPPGQTPPRQTPPWADTTQTDTPLGRHTLPSVCWDTCPPATAADGTHPTGMHSCSFLSIENDSGLTSCRVLSLTLNHAAQTFQEQFLIVLFLTNFHGVESGPLPRLTGPVRH